MYNFQVIYFICFYSNIFSFQHGALLPFSVTFWPGLFNTCLFLHFFDSLLTDKIRCQFCFWSINTLCNESGYTLFNIHWASSFTLRYCYYTAAIIIPIPYFSDHKMHWTIRRTLTFLFDFSEKNNDECILILVIYWKKTGLVHTKISKHNLIYSS